MGSERKTKRITLNFLARATGRRALPSNKLARIMGEEGLGSETRSLVLDMLSLICPLDT